MNKTECEANQGRWYEELMPCPVVDSVYYELQSKPTTDPDKRENGLQFYVDFKGNENYGNFFRWQLIAGMANAQWVKGKCHPSK